MTATFRHLTVVPTPTRRLRPVAPGGAPVYHLPTRRNAGCQDCAHRTPGHGEAA